MAKGAGVAGQKRGEAHDESKIPNVPCVTVQLGQLPTDSGAAGQHPYRSTVIHFALGF
jgi:hypothetical protein